MLFTQSYKAYKPYNRKNKFLLIIYRMEFTSNSINKIKALLQQNSNIEYSNKTQSSNSIQQS